jgi:hypothetical protein
MLPIAGQTAGPMGLNFLWTLMGGRGVFKAKKTIFFSKFFFFIFFKFEKKFHGLSAS